MKQPNDNTAIAMPRATNGTTEPAKRGLIPVKPAATSRLPVAIGVVVETPAEAKAVYLEYRPSFSNECAAWLVLGKSGQMRVVDVPIIAMHLQNKRERYIVNEIPAGLDSDKETKLRNEARDTLKKMRKTWKASQQSVKDGWIAKAKPLFNKALREFLKKTAPLKKAFSDSRFQTSRATVHLTKKGKVHVAMQTTCEKFVAQPAK